MRRLHILAVLPLAACAQTAPQTTPPPPGETCNSEGLARFVGQSVTADLGAAMLAASGARSLRWAPPRSAMTMDFRADRLTVAYDDDMKVISANCG